MAFGLQGYPALRAGPARAPAPPIGHAQRGYAHKTKPAAWRSGGFYTYVENSLEKKNFQANGFGDIAPRNRSSILTPHEQLLSRIDRYQCDPDFRTEMKEQYRRLMSRVENPHLPPRSRAMTPSRMTTPPAGGESGGPSPTTPGPSNTEEKQPIFRSAGTQTSPELEQPTIRTTLRRPPSGGLSRPQSAPSLPRRR